MSLGPDMFGSRGAMVPRVGMTTDMRSTKGRIAMMNRAKEAVCVRLIERVY